MKQNLSHILDSSVCITKRQLKEYAAGTISDEECHAMEHHINGCVFCSAALDGMLLHTPDETLAVTTQFNGTFLKAHFSLNSPQVHLNSMGPSITRKPGKHKHTKQPFWLKTSLAAAVVIGVAVILLMQTGRGESAFSFKHISIHKEAPKTLTPQAVHTIVTKGAAVASK